MADDESLLLRSRLTIHRQLNPNYCVPQRTGVVDQLGDLHHSQPLRATSSSLKSDESDGDEKIWDRREGGNVVAKRNARERTRVHTVNQAFLLLKSHLPSLRSHTKRVSKLKILKAAINYIDALLDLIKKEEAHHRHHLKHNAHNSLKHQNALGAAALADRSLAAPLAYQMQSILDCQPYLYSTHHPPPSQQHQHQSAHHPQPIQPQPIHPFLLNGYH